MKKIALTSAIVVAMLLSICFQAYAGGGLYYLVKPGDTLYGIGNKFGVNYRVIMETNRLAEHSIRPGLKLSIPTDKYSVHMVSPGDTLFAVSRKYGVKVKDIKKTTGLNSDIIVPGMKLLVPSGPAFSENKGLRKVFSFSNLTKEDIYLLAKLIHAEARGESLEGQVAVGAVIMNRLNSSMFPGSIREIIFQRTNGVYQFTPVQDGQINLEPDRNSFYAAEKAIKGEDPTGGAIFFYNPETSSDQWIKTLPVTKVIGNHVFAK